MKTNKILVLSIFVVIVFSFIAISQEINKKVFSPEEQAKIIEEVCGVWKLESRVFKDGTVLKSPDVSGYLMINKKHWVQVEAQIKKVGDVEPFAASYFGTMDIEHPRSIEGVLLSILATKDTKKDEVSLTMNTKEAVQKTTIIIDEKGVTQRFDAGGQVTMSNGRFVHKVRRGYINYWVRIAKNEELY